MLKYHKLTSFLIGLFFLIVLQKFAAPEPIFRFLVPAFLIYAGLVTIYNRWYLRKMQKYNFWMLIRPILLLTSGFGIFLIIPSEGLRGSFLFFTVAVITLFEITIDNFAENILLIETLVIAFGLFFSFAAFYQYVPAYGTLYLAGIFFGSSLLARAFYELLPQPPLTKLVSALTIGFFCSELFWSFNFLPLHFSVLGFLLFNLFYICLILNYYYLFHNLNLKKVKFHIFLTASTSILVLLATPWKIIN